MRTVLTLMVVALLALSAVADWRQFRGNDTTSSDSSCVLPDKWSAEGENIAWKVELPGRGPSSPIVVGDKVIVTTASGADSEQLHVLCYSTAEGKLLWQRNFWATGRTFCHSQSTPAAPSPVSDGKHVYAFFGSNDLACLDLDGNLLWYRGLGYEHPKAGNDVGMASSPLVIDETVIVQIENQGDSFAAGINAANGQTRWFLPREEKANWASPIAITSSDKHVALLQNSGGITAVEPKSGEILWEMGGGASTISSAVAASGKAYIASQGLTMLDLQNPAVQPEIKWEVSKLNPSSMSPILHNQKVYIINGAGVLTCADAATGEIEWPLRLKGPFWASPVIAGSKLYAANFSGTVFVVDLSGKKGKIVEQIEMGENLQATPALDGNAMYLKGEHHLWKIAGKK
ncbi:PQQ-binding-like beta-propeller repeat protein [Blastopirellula marina]|uniref:Pyrrolo-quinoline quinone n=1 Tax=Blastopirellula marina TaxID=124 RepID=A0A2S8GE48_9BACT|nr:PQQ-binding-like beta-propeller repeat protein [Blastopirellula marina]PQO42580.1 pyrrolo-quinoline quinone [Blastopirellula marina]PTL46346.1 pyrrolo-quinoline quinone [Blastopirellula marina]